MLWRVIDRRAAGSIDFQEFCDLCLSATNVSQAARHGAAAAVASAAQANHHSESAESFFFGRANEVTGIATRLEVEGTVSGDARRCFAGNQVKCKLCSRLVPVVQLEAHAAECVEAHDVDAAAPRAASERLGHLAEEGAAGSRSSEGAADNWI